MNFSLADDLNISTFATLLLQPDFRKSWDVYLNLNKMKTKRINSNVPIFYSQQNIDNIKKMFKLGNIHFYPLNELISKVMPATGLINVVNL